MLKNLKPNKNTKAIEPPSDAKTLRPDPHKLFTAEKIDRATLAGLKGRSLISSHDFSKKEVIELCKFAALLEATEISTHHPLDGKIVITAFFEASTRTRTSFESAILRLDGKVISIPDEQVTGVKKGESLADIGEMFNAYGDLVIMRHTETDSIEKIGQNLRVPLINAGNGSGEHPTQALADWFALLKWNPLLAFSEVKDKPRLHLGILGTPGNMRAVKSFLLMSLLFQENFRRVTVISEMADPLGPELEEEIRKAGIEVEVTNDLQAVVSDLDVIYMNSIALLGDSYTTVDSRYKLDKTTKLKPEAVIMHPLARRDELDTCFDRTKHNLYFSQAHGAVFVRQAILISLLDRLNTLPKNLPIK